MKTIFTVLQDIERLIYRVLIWIILIPKTVVKIVINPTWAHDYIRGELKQEESPFDEYMSPVILLLVVALLPALVFNSLPTYNSVITSPAEEKPTTDRILSFEAQTKFLSTSPDMEFVHLWTVEQVKEDGSYEVVGGESHFSDTNVIYTEKVDNRTAKDRFLFTFTNAGEYYVNVYAGKYDPQLGRDRILEDHSAYIKVIVPLKTDEQIIISNDTAKTTVETEVIQSAGDITDQIQKERTIFLALALMMPPLIFALAIKLFTKDEIGEITLKDHFYVQCYFFTPLSLAIWASYYAYYFYTADAFFYLGERVAFQILMLPTILAMIWFFRTEMKTIAYERNTKSLFSFLIVTLCLAVLGGAAYVILFFQNIQDRIRLFSIQVYPLAATALIIAFIVAWMRRRRAKNQGVTMNNLSWVFVSVLFLFFVSMIISRETPSLENELAFASTQIAGLPSKQGTQVSDLPISFVTPTADIPQGTSTPVAAIPLGTSTPVLDFFPATTPTPLSAGFPAPPTPTEQVVLAIPTTGDQPYYTEDFNNDIPDWIRFMTFGDTRMVKETVGLGNLSISILPIEDKYAWYYLINNKFSYSNVKVEAVVTNQGNNANGVSLICRYSDIGWYEFVVSNSGVYSILAVDNQGIVNQGYNEIASGGSSKIKAGRQTNVYTAICNGNELSLIINQSEVWTLTDAKFQFAEGKIGIAVSSPEKLPVKVEFESMTVGQP